MEIIKVSMCRYPMEIGSGKPAGSVSEIAAERRTRGYRESRAFSDGVASPYGRIEVLDITQVEIR
ncbi:MAG: hypothetical protein RQ839_06770 [Thermoproteus sp.]|jgi:hypothetical protein|nr:hypothetical protein [Thermoproteus sp.]